VISRGSEVIGGIRKERAVVVIETDAEETPLPLGVIEDGVTEQAESFGAPVHVNEIGWLKPPSGLIARVRVTDCPAFNVGALGETESEKSCPVPERLTVWGLCAALSVMERVPVRLPPAEGLKLTLIEQLAPAARLEPQLLD
jgi:hypothetical protein